MTRNPLWYMALWFLGAALAPLLGVAIGYRLHPALWTLPDALLTLASLLLWIGYLIHRARLDYRQMLYEQMVRTLITLQKENPR